MSKKIISYVLTLAMIFSVFCNPALGYATTEAIASEVTDTTAAEEPSDDTNTTENIEEPSDGAEQNKEREEVITVPEPGTVKNLKASAISRNKISLKWNKVKGATGYEVYRYNKSKKKYVCITKVKSNAVSNTKLSSGTLYTYKVRAYVTENGETYRGAFSGTVKCKTLPYVGKVTGPSVKANSDTSLTIKWKKVSGAKAYQVYRYNKAKKKYVLLKTVKGTKLNNLKLKDDTLYSYKIRAYKVQDGKKYYGEFSKVVKGRTEKTDQDKIKALAYSKRDCQYKYGAKGPKKFDCSGFVHWVYDNADVDVKKEVPDTSSSGQYSALKKYMIGTSIKSIDKAETGDIIFFKHGGRVSHVGIYYGDGKMIHAANPKKDICIESVKDYNSWGFKVVGIARVI